MTIEAQLAEQAREIAALREMVIGPQARRPAFVAGSFTPPADLIPAVMALSVRAFQRLQEVTAGRSVTANDLVMVSDWDREAA